MQIIDELEEFKRGVYTGSAGYFGLDGDMDLNILIRTFLLQNGRAYFHVGGGIVADSDTESEYHETLAKGRALFDALQSAQSETTAYATRPPVRTAEGGAWTAGLEARSDARPPMPAPSGAAKD